MEIQLLATLPDEKRAQRLKELRTLNTSTKKANPLVAVVNVESAFKATELLVNHSSYFLDMPEMNVKWLYNELCGVHGGVSKFRNICSLIKCTFVLQLMCSAITAMAHKLDLCLTDTVLELEDVERFLGSAGDVASEIKQRVSQLQRGKKVEELQKLLPVSVFCSSFTFT
jgi:hypothetical protein